MNVTITFGAMSPQLREQLQHQGMRTRDANQLKHLQMDADAVTRLCVRGMITQGETHNARKKITKKIRALELMPLDTTNKED